MFSVNTAVPNGLNKLPIAPPTAALPKENFVLVEMGTTFVLLQNILGQRIVFATLMRLLIVQVVQG